MPWGTRVAHAWWSLSSLRHFGGPLWTVRELGAWTSTANIATATMATSAAKAPKGKTAYFIFTEAHREAVKAEVLAAKGEGAKVRTQLTQLSQLTATSA